jgi:hypothetical protein
MRDLVADALNVGSASRSVEPGVCLDFIGPPPPNQLDKAQPIVDKETLTPYLDAALHSPGRLPNLFLHPITVVMPLCALSRSRFRPIFSSSLAREQARFYNSRIGKPAHVDARDQRVMRVGVLTRLPEHDFFQQKCVAGNLRATKSAVAKSDATET